MTEPTVDAVAAELYALPLASFIRERDARAAATVDRTVAAGIRRLRKPSLAAWVVNVLAGKRAHEMNQALELGAALRDAQEDFDAATLAALNAQRRALVAGLARNAVTLANDEGVTVSRSAQEEVERTLNAAMRDAAAADAVMTRRLLRALDVVGLDPVDLEGAVAGAIPPRAADAPHDDLSERRSRREAERVAREAAQVAAEVERRRAAAMRARDTAREHAGRVRERIDELRRELARAEADGVRADAAEADAEAELGEPR